jgi:hypothetical protein
VGRTDAVARFTREELFDDPILERVERDHHDPPARAEDAHGCRESLLEVRELVVDRDTESLEDACRGVDAARPPRLHAGDETAEIVSRLERRFDTATDDRSRDARRLRLLAVLGEDSSKVLLSPAVHDVGRRGAKIRIGTHVEWSSGTEAEAPLFVGQLDGREAEVEEDAVDRGEAVLAGEVVEIREVPSREDHAIAEAREVSPGDGERSGVAIESEKPAARPACVKDGGGVPSPTDSPVQKPATVVDSELGECFGQENGLMSPLRLIAKSRGP